MGVLFLSEEDVVNTVTKTKLPTFARVCCARKPVCCVRRVELLCRRDIFVDIDMLYSYKH